MTERVTRQSNVRYRSQLPDLAAPLFIVHFGFNNAYRNGSSIPFHPCPEPIDYFDAMLIFLEQAIAPHFYDAQAAAIFSRQIKYGLYGQTQRCLKKRKGIQQPFTAA
jgi:hypothetical protein